MPDVFYNNISLSGEDNEIVQFMSDITLVGDRAYYTNRHGYLSLIGNKFQCNNMNKISFDTNSIQNIGSILLYFKRKYTSINFVWK